MWEPVAKETYRAKRKKTNNIPVQQSTPSAKPAMGERTRLGSRSVQGAQLAGRYLCKAEKRLLGLSRSGPCGSTVPLSLTQ